jgi:hypothetical protein
MKMERISDPLSGAGDGPEPKPKALVTAPGGH